MRNTQRNRSEHQSEKKTKRRSDFDKCGGIEPVELPFGGLLDWRTPRVLKRQIKVYRPDVVLTWMNRATRMCPKGISSTSAGWAGITTSSITRIATT
jgi:hypothetical protein